MCAESFWAALEIQQRHGTTSKTLELARSAVLHRSDFDRSLEYYPTFYPLLYVPKPTHLSRMNFSKVPVDVILHIVTFLEYGSDLNSFVRTSKFFYHLLNDYLYRDNVLHFGSSALAWAARNGFENTVRRSLEAGALPSACVDEEWQPMALAAAHGHEQVVKLFLDLGLDPCRKERWRTLTEEFQNQDETDEEGYPGMSYKRESDPLTLAIENGFENVVRLLNTYGAMRDWNTQNAIHAMCLAVTGGHLVLVKLLAEWFPQSINGASRYRSERPLAIAIEQNELAIARFLTSLGADVNIACDRNLTPLCWAVILGNLAAIKFLVENGACPAPEMCDGATLWPLRWAAESEKYDVVEYLLSKIDINTKISTGTEDVAILLSVSAFCGIESLLRETLASGCDANMICSFSYPNLSSAPRPALSAAAERGHVDIATILLEHGARLYRKEEDDEDPEYEPIFTACQPIFAACQGGHIETVELLLDYGLDLKEAERGGKSTVISAMGFPLIIDLLLSRGADGQAQFSEDRSNPMTEAVSSGHIASIQVLLDHNVPVEPSIFSVSNQSLIGEAINGKDGPATLDLLAVHGVVALAGDRDVQRVLRGAVQRGHAKATEFFLKNGFDPNMKWDGDPRYSRSYLEDALRAEDQEAAEATIDMLLRYGADIRNLQGYQHNFYAFEGESKCLCYAQILLDRGANPLPENRFGLSLLEFTAVNNFKTFLREILRYISAQNLPFAVIHRNFALVKSNPKVRKNWHVMNIWESFYWRNKYPVS
jgi:ankyrin repeat protein